MKVVVVVGTLRVLPAGAPRPDSQQRGTTTPYWKQYTCTTMATKAEKLQLVKQDEAVAAAASVAAVALGGSLCHRWELFS